MKVALVLCLILILSVLSWNSFKPEPKWEYSIESIPDWDFQRKMNSLGQDGWELVFARRASTGPIDTANPDFAYEIILKRKAR